MRQNLEVSQTSSLDDQLQTKRNSDLMIQFQTMKECVQFQTMKELAALMKLTVWKTKIETLDVDDDEEAEVWWLEVEVEDKN